MQAFSIITPMTDMELENYYKFRWQLLREPWHQPRGSERDELEENAFHRMICDEHHTPVAIGRLHLINNEYAQIRYMAVAPERQGKGLGSMILQELEAIASENCISAILVNARDTAKRFYEKHGYQVTTSSHTLFNAIPHYKMEKYLHP